MSWIQQLVKTYDNCEAAIGIQTAAEGEKEKVPLLPIAHTTITAHVEITLDQNGKFIRAQIVPSQDKLTIIPCTEKSLGGRTSGPAPHPLCDSLQYVAIDYVAWGGKKKPYFNEYHQELSKWEKSQYSDPKLKAIKRYIEKELVISDLVKEGILIADESKQLAQKKGKTREQLQRMPIFSVIDDQTKVFVRWRVNTPGVLESRVWKDNKLWKKWTDYYWFQKKEIGLCQITGIATKVATHHPAKIRYDGDTTKIISSNNDDGFTFRGKFSKADQAVSVGFEITQKAHSALRWLINRQGYRVGELTIVAWSIDGQEIPQPLDDQMDLLGINTMESTKTTEVFTAQDVGIRVRKAFAGYRQRLGNLTNIVVIGLSCPPKSKGRLSIILYLELSATTFLKNMEDWYESCQWKLNHIFIPSKNQETGQKRLFNFPMIGTPSPDDIVEAIYGRRVRETLHNSIVTRLLPCILERRPIPQDIVESAVRKAISYYSAGSNNHTLSMEELRAWQFHPLGCNDNWEWEKSLSIACALYRKHKTEENYKMALEEDRTTRDYLYGRLLALADYIEGFALWKAKEQRETNAARLFQRFAERPFSTWKSLSLMLPPYKARFIKTKSGGKLHKLMREMDQIISAFKAEDFTSDKPLSGEFLLGYHCQRESLWTSGEQNEDASEEANQEN